MAEQRPGEEEEPEVPEVDEGGPAPRSRFGWGPRSPLWLHPRRELTPEERRKVLDQLFDEKRDRALGLARHAILMVLSTGIATFGLVADSAAVVIGAMVVAPVMRPITALAAATVMAWPRRQLSSALIILGSVVGAVAVAAGLSAVVRTEEALGISDELLARTNPGLLDLGVAVFAGTAGAYVTIRLRAAAALPGVAIAVALVPPLATAGVMLQLGRFGDAEGAMLLFATNLAAIALSAMVVFAAAGFVPRGRALRERVRIRIGLATGLLAVGAVAIPLTLHSMEVYEHAADRDRMSEEVEAWIGDRDLEVVEVEYEPHGEHLDVHVELAGPRQPPPVRPLARAIARTTERPIDLDLNWTHRDTTRIVASP